MHGFELGEMKKSAGVLWSTNDSAAAGVPSVMATIETFVSVIFFGWLAINYDTFRPMMLSALIVAPLVLLRSPQAQARGIKWFIVFEKRIDALLSPKNKIFGLEFDLLFDLVMFPSLFLCGYCFLNYTDLTLAVKFANDPEEKAIREVIPLSLMVMSIAPIIMYSAVNLILLHRTGGVSSFG